MSGLFRLRADTGNRCRCYTYILSKAHNIPDGIRVEQNDVYYNELVGVSGTTIYYAASANTTNGFTYTGTTGSTGTCDTNFGVSTINVTSPNYDYTEWSVLGYGWKYDTTDTAYGCGAWMLIQDTI